MANYSFIFVIHFVEDLCSVGHHNGESLRVDHKEGPGADRRANRIAGHFNFYVKDREKRFLHITYKDFSKSRHNVYVVCAGKVAKVFTDAGTRLLKMADFYHGQNWLVFAVEHNQKIISYECATKLKDSHASFKFIFDRRSLPSKMASEKLNHTYSGKMAAQDIRTFGGQVVCRAGQLAELHEVNSKKATSTVRKPIIDRRQSCQAYETIIELSDTIAKLSKVNNQRPGRNSKETTGDHKKIELNGQTLFYDDNFSKSFLLNPVVECYGLAVILDVGSFYNEELKKYFIPLVLRIPRMKGLPIRRLQLLKIKNLFLESDKYADVLFNQKITIGPVPITGKTTEINYKAVCILNSQKILEAVEMVQIKCVRFEVFCELSEQVEEEEIKLYGDHPLDTVVGDREKFTEQWKYSKLLDGYKGRHPHAIRLKHHKATILGYAQFDLSDLVHGSQVISAVEPLFMHFSFARQLTPFEEYIFEEHELHDFNTTIELSVRVGYLLNYGFDWDNGKFLKKYMTRVVIVCNNATDMSQLEQFYKELLDYNKMLVGRNGQPSNLSAFTKSEQMFSGYFVVCAKYAILFVEGTHGSLDRGLREYFPRIDQPHLLYDRTMIFKNPSYSAFYDIGGFYHVSLCHPLETYLDKYATYLEGNVPADAWQCLFKLKSSMQCTTLKQFFHYGLAADINELKQFNEEFGVFAER